MVPEGVCSGGSFPLPAGSRYFITANFFRTRDAFRQNVLDQSALALAISRPPQTASGAPYPQPSANPFTAALPAHASGSGSSGSSSPPCSPPGGVICSCCGISGKRQRRRSSP